MSYSDSAAAAAASAQINSNKRQVNGVIYCCCSRLAVRHASADSLTSVAWPWRVSVHNVTLNRHSTLYNSSPLVMAQLSWLSRQSNWYLPLPLCQSTSDNHAVPCLRPRSTRNCGWVADLASGRECTQTFRRKFKRILNCLFMCQSQTRPKRTILSQKI